MSTFGSRVLMTHYKILTYVRTKANCKFYSVYCGGNNRFSLGVSKQKCSSIYGTQLKLYVQPKRNFSVESINSVNLRIYNFVTTSYPSIELKSILVSFHDFTGLPWWATIVFATSIIKLMVSLPLGIFQNYVGARIKLTKIEFSERLEELKSKILCDSRRGKWTDSKKNLRFSQEARRMWKRMVIENNCHPMKIFILGFIQFPVWILFSLTFRNLTEPGLNPTVPSKISAQLAKEGPIWCRDLRVPDHSLILPGILSFTSYSLIQISTLSSSGVGGKLSRIMTGVFKGIAIFSFFVSMSMPSCVSLYWATSVLFGFAQNLLLLSPKFKRLCRIPITPLDLANPYSTVLLRLKQKYIKFFTFNKKSKV